MPSLLALGSKAVSGGNQSICERAMAMSSPAIQPSWSPVRRGRLPLEPKIALTVFVAVLIPVYLFAKDYGLRNFLYACDIALLLTVVGMWIESRLLLSMQAVGILVIQAIWSFDYFAHYGVGYCPLGMADYPFRCSFILHFLTLFHVWLPLLLLWAVWRLGYDRRAWAVQSAYGIIMGLVTAYFCDPEWNINWSKDYFSLTMDGILAGRLPASLDFIYRFFHSYTQWRLSQGAVVARALDVFWGLCIVLFVLYLPAHLLLIRFFEKQPRRPAESLAPTRPQRLGQRIARLFWTRTSVTNT
jgi:hypothetical protein